MDEGEMLSFFPFVFSSLPSSSHLHARCQVASPPGSALGPSPSVGAPQPEAGTYLFK